ncbi:MAG: hypothetical protein FNP40_12295 [Dehalobacter sp. 4CP]|uniref:hypothetical protein n=1 Tax=Dehalobacter sp. CP TaxID=2594474 RepID=UPI0013C82514|nr:hypothetical protein [Dehalobacter sp. 4CP]
MNKKLIIIGVLLAGILSSFGFYNQQSYADETKSAQKLSQLAGEYVKNNPELISKSVVSIDSSNPSKKVIFDPEEIVATIDSLKITKGEIEFRKGLRIASGTGNADDKSVFNTLVEEKLIINYAIKNGVFPSEEKVNYFIQSEKAIYEQNVENKQMIDSFCSAANMTIDQYWDVYEYYNAFRIVTFKNAYDKAIELAVNNGDLPALGNDNQANSEIIKKYKEYWDNLKKELKSITSIKVEQQDYNFVVDKSRLYF